MEAPDQGAARGPQTGSRPQASDRELPAGPGPGSRLQASDREPRGPPLLPGVPGRAEPWGHGEGSTLCEWLDTGPTRDTQNDDGTEALNMPPSGWCHCSNQDSIPREATQGTAASSGAQPTAPTLSVGQRVHEAGTWLLWTILLSGCPSPLIAQTKTACPAARSAVDFASPWQAQGPLTLCSLGLTLRWPEKPELPSALTPGGGGHPEKLVLCPWQPGG